MSAIPFLSAKELPAPYNQYSYYPWYSDARESSPYERGCELYYDACRYNPQTGKLDGLHPPYKFEEGLKSYFKIHLWLTRIDPENMQPRDIILENGQSLRAVVYAALTPIIKKLNNEINTYKLRCTWATKDHTSSRPIPDVVVYVFNRRQVSTTHTTEAPERAVTVLKALYEIMKPLVTNTTKPGFKALFNAYPFADCPHVSVMQSDTETRYQFIKCILGNNKFRDEGLFPGELSLSQDRKLSYREYQDFYYNYLRPDEQFPGAKTRLQEAWSYAFTPDGCCARYGSECWSQLLRLLVNVPVNIPASSPL